MFAHINPRDVYDCLVAKPEKPRKPVHPPATDRAAWDERRAADPQWAAEMIDHARDACAQRVTALRASEYLMFQRTGDRRTFERHAFDRRERLALAVLAECFEGEGRWADEILDLVWLTCEESSWCAPAHEVPMGGRKGLPDVGEPMIDLFAAITAQDLAEADLVVGHLLPEIVRERIRREIDRRILSPYLQRNWLWLYGPSGSTRNNWTAVCAGGVCAAAIHMVDDRLRLAEILARAMTPLDQYLAGFSPDGGCSEGVGYWGFGMTQLVLAAELIAGRTDGAIDLLADPRLEAITAFPARSYLAGGRWATFSDCPPDARPQAWTLATLGERWGDRAAVALADDHGRVAGPRRVSWLLRDARFVRDRAARGGSPYVPTLRDDLEQMQWFVSRVDPSDPGALVVACKGGHNQEMHNQCDVGSFLILLAGEPLVPDPGAGLYTRQYFSGEEIFTKTSLAHSVPVVDGKGQPRGWKHRAEVVARECTDRADRLELDLTAAYDAPGLSQLRRKLVLDRSSPGGRVELIDSYRFESDGSVAGVLVSHVEPAVGDGEVVYAGRRASLRVRFDASEITATVRRDADVPYKNGPVDLYRASFERRDGAREGCIALVIEPI
jgi:hypothetical protein